MLTGTEPKSGETFASLAQGRELVLIPSLAEALVLLRTQPFEGVYISAKDPSLWQETQLLLQNEAILDVLGEGVAILQPDARILWANPTFERWCGGPAQGRTFCDALGSPKILGPNCDPLGSACKGTCVQTRLQRREQFLELRLAPILDASGKVQRIIALCRDVSAEFQNQQKLDALHQAGAAWHAC